MPESRPTVIQPSDLQQAAENAAELALSDHDLDAVSGGTILTTDPGTTTGMFPTEPTVAL